MPNTIVVESRIVVYDEDKNVAHIFASNSTPVALSRLDTTHETAEELAACIQSNMESLQESTALMLKDQPLDVGDLRENVIDNALLREVLKACDQGRARILQSRVTRSGTDQPSWYCILVKKV